ncbi:hypothetical protein GALMADRAFT_154478 [Galerina marginata CBS 339.88]|uniref:DUF6534 domain-containing protein n=1 Tax=Galerina marginata (strain CBS 339.88) TaxID=685588 RepID=A0A067TID8_GALM3|nr:hypothetical protein GALMADRAFT_154478 [Galerina marginata CBS 339.88]
MAESLSKQLNLDVTIGAAFIGCIIAAVFYGITCLQTFTYFKKGRQDPTFLKTVICFLWSVVISEMDVSDYFCFRVIDTLHLAFIAHALYFYLITNYGNPTALEFPTWTILSQIYLTICSDSTVRIIYARRVWIFSRSLMANIGIGLIILFPFVSGFTYCTLTFTEDTSFISAIRISYLLYISFGSAVLADLIIATALCVSLYRSRTGSKRTDPLLTVLMLYAINSTVLTTVCQLACFITNIIWPRQLVFLGIYFSLGKLYFNSLLATLNNRSSLNKRLDEPLDFHMSLSEPTIGRVDYSDFSHSNVEAQERTINR